MHRRTLAVAVTLSVGLALVACGDDDTGDTAGPTTTEAGTSSSTSSSGATSTEVPDPGELPGEIIEIFPYEGAALAVVGVDADDTLNVRVGPGVDSDVAFTLDPLDMASVATGTNRQLDDGSIWAELTNDGRTGWANAAFLLQPGEVLDVTTDLYPEPADRPGAETMLELGEVVGADVASDDPPSEITVVDGPTVGDLGEITVDVIGLGDDALGGVRVHVFAEPLPDGETFQVRTVEQTLLCSRGVTDDGLCV